MLSSDLDHFYRMAHDAACLTYSKILPPLHESKSHRDSLEVPKQSECIHCPFSVSAACAIEVLFTECGKFWSSMLQSPSSHNHPRKSSTNLGIFAGQCSSCSIRRTSHQPFSQLQGVARAQMLVKERLELQIPVFWRDAKVGDNANLEYYMIKKADESVV